MRLSDETLPSKTRLNQEVKVFFLQIGDGEAAGEDEPTWITHTAG
jgi:hypothetical protein